MGMTANHLISGGLCHLIKGEKSFLLSKQCMENNLQQEIAKLFPEIGRISGGRENVDAADNFGGFFNGNLWIVGVAAAVLAVIVTVAVSLFTKPVDPAVLNRMKGLKAEG